MGFFGKKDKKEKKAEKKTVSVWDGRFRCPYCFKEMSQEDVAFRAKTSYRAQDINGLSDDDEKRRKERYQEKEDSVYKAFWDMYPGSKPEDKVNDKESKRTFEKHAVLSQSDDSLVFKRDVDGFLNEVIDTEKVSSKIRICPLCHNRLPFEFGKYPVKYISVVGVSDSGKTIYLSRVLEDIAGILYRAGMTVAGQRPELENFVDENRIQSGWLAGSTVTNKLTLPMPVNVKARSGETVTLVFYDIAGENCVDSDRMGKYGPFIRNADGIIMVIDPGQFTDLIDMSDFDDEGGKKDQRYSPGKVLDAMHDAFGSADFAGGVVSIPLALSISKSDLLKKKRVLEEYSNVFQDIHYDEYETGFPEDEWKNVHGELEILLTDSSSEKGRILDDQLRTFFPAHGYFAFSTLNVQPEKRNDGKQERWWLETVVSPRRVEEPLLWILYQLGLIDKAEKKAKNR